MVNEKHFLRFFVLFSNRGIIFLIKRANLKIKEHFRRYVIELIPMAIALQLLIIYRI